MSKATGSAARHTRYRDASAVSARRPSGLEFYNPDYQLTAESPLWAGSHRHPSVGPPTMSIHAGMEVGIVLAGREEVQLDGRLIPGDAGDVWMCAMSEPHTYRIVEPDTENLVLVFLPSFLGEEMLGDTPWLNLFAVGPRDRPTVTTVETRDTVMAIARELKKEVERRKEGWECAVRLNLLRLLFCLRREWRGQRPAGARAAAHSGNLSRIMPALALLHERNPQLVSRDEAAQACGLGRSRFTMVFHETMGVSFKTFRKRARIAFAANLLLSSDLPLAAVAERAGFADLSHLHHSFVQEYDCTPGRFRRQAEPGMG